MQIYLKIVHHEEGSYRIWGIKAKEFVGKDKIEYVRTEDISWDKQNKNFYVIKNSISLFPVIYY